MNKLKIIKNWYLLFKEGNKIKDKLIIISYLFYLPISKFLFHKKPDGFLGEVRIKNKYGILCSGKNVTSTQIACSNYETPLISNLDYLKEGAFVDIGANIGKYAIYAGSKGNKIIAIEPEPRNFNLLKRNIKLNGLENNSILFNGACLDKNGTARLWVDNASLIKEILRKLNYEFNNEKDDKDNYLAVPLEEKIIK